MSKTVPCVAIALVVVVLSARCQTAASAQGLPVGNQPLMTGIASAPINATVSTTITYSIEQTDEDTYSLGIKLIDATCAIRVKKVNSMSSYQWRRRGIKAPATFVYDVTGTAVATAGTYYDDWILFNRRISLDQGLDPPVEVTQTVILGPTIVPPGG